METQLQQQITPPSKPQRIVFEIQDATVEGIATQGQNLKFAGALSMFLKFPEFGMYLKTGNKQQQQLQGAILSMYDNKIPAKVIKSEEAVESMCDIPINILAYTDYTTVKGDIQGMFDTLMSTGYNRRFTISFQPPQKLVFNPFSDEEERQLNDRLKTAGKKLFDLFSQLPMNACYKLLPETKNIYNNYSKQKTDEYNEEKNGIKQTEIISRPFKVLKLSCLYACLNHPQEYVIKTDDFQQAIKTVENLSTDFGKFLVFQPANMDKYEKAYEFLKQNIGKIFTKTQLIKIFNGFNFNRDLLRQNFAKEMAAIQELATDDGYIITQITNECKNGTYYTLEKRNTEPLSQDTKPLTDIINQSAPLSNADIPQENPTPF